MRDISLAGLCLDWYTFNLQASNGWILVNTPFDRTELICSVRIKRWSENSVWSVMGPNSIDASFVFFPCYFSGLPCTPALIEFWEAKFPHTGLEVLFSSNCFAFWGRWKVSLRSFHISPPPLFDFIIKNLTSIQFQQPIRLPLPLFRLFSQFSDASV
jgi:hypothetical protein